jgi:2-aminobenzoate-CoA ligase
VLKAGGVAVTTMPLLRAREIGDIVEQARVTLAITDARVASDLERGDGRPRRRRALCASAVTRGEPGLQPGIADRPADRSRSRTSRPPPTIRPSSRFTSGTTGRSKGTVHTHRDLMAVTDTYGRYVLKPRCGRHLHRFAADRVHLCAGRPRVFPMRFGASTALIEQASPPLLLEGIQKFRATITITSPTAYRAMLKQAGDST